MYQCIFQPVFYLYQKHTDTTKREVRNAKAATCTLDGYSGDIYCTNCGNLIEAGSVTKAIGHQWDNGVITKEIGRAHV